MDATRMCSQELISLIILTPHECTTITITYLLPSHFLFFLHFFYIHPHNYISSLKTVYLHFEFLLLLHLSCLVQDLITFIINIRLYKFITSADLEQQELVGLKNNSTRCTCTCPFIETIAESLCAVINISEGSYIEWRQQDFSTLTNTSGDLLFKCCLLQSPLVHLHSKIMIIK